jgi:type II secretory pathway pseudopilin PulG
MKFSKKAGCLLTLIVSPILVILLLVAAIAIRDSVNGAELKRKLNALTVAGKPIDDNSLDSLYRSTTDATDAMEWISVLEIVNAPDFIASAKGIPEFDPAVTHSNNPEVLFEEPERVRAFLQATAELRNQIRVLSLKAKPVQFPVKFQSLNTLLPNTQNIRQASRLIHLEGKFAVYERDSQSIANSINALSGMSIVCSKEPFLVSHLVSIAVEGLAWNLLRQALEVDALETRELDDLMNTLNNQPSVSESWRSAINGERAMILSLFQNPANLRQFMNSSDAMVIPARSADALLALELFQRAEEANPDSPEQFRNELDAIDEQLRESVGGSLLGRLDSIITSLSLPALNSAGKAFLRRSQYRQLALIGLAIRKYEDQHGQLPTDLGQLKQLETVKNSLVFDQSQYGYRSESDYAIMWGSDYRVSNTPSANPPDPSSPDYNILEDWGIWRFQVMKQQ